MGVPYATAYRALFQRARARAGETVLVHGGSGGVGVAAIQLARAAGMKVIATAGSEQGRALVLQHGATQVFDHRDPQRWEAIRDTTHGHGVDVVVEMRADANLGNDLTILARGGRVVIVGSRGTVEVNPRDCMAREAEILGLLLWQMSAADYRAVHAALVAGLEAGTLTPVIARELPLDQAALAHRQVLEPGALGKIVLRM
jgi:NADPH2:quinone reductase